MKKLPLISSLFRDESAFKQKVLLPLSVDNSIYYEQLVQLDSSYTQQALYTAAKTWFINNADGYKSVVQSDDEERGHVFGKVTIAGSGDAASLKTMGAYVQACIQVDVSEGKYRFVVYNLQNHLANDNFKQPTSKPYLRYVNNNFRYPVWKSASNFYQKLDYNYSYLKTHLDALCHSLIHAMDNSNSNVSA